MKKFNLTVILIATSICISLPAFAGTWHKGYGETIKEATDNAASLASTAVISRGTGCVDKSEKPKKDGDLWMVRVHQSHHNGSCGKKSKDQETFNEAVWDGLKAYLAS